MWNVAGVEAPYEKTASVGFTAQQGHGSFSLFWKVEETGKAFP